MLAMHFSDNIQWVSIKCPQKGPADSVRTVVHQLESEEDKQDHLDVDHPQHCVPRGGDPALHPHHAPRHLIQVIDR